MDIADDADGRVAIFTVDAPYRASPGGPPPVPVGPQSARPAERLAALLDSAYAGVGIVAVLVVVLVLGLLFARH